MWRIPKLSVVGSSPCDKGATSVDDLLSALQRFLPTGRSRPSALSPPQAAQLKLSA